MFRWKRAVLHALIPFGLVIAAGFVLLIVAHPVDDEKAGEGVGQFACFAAVAGFGISYLAQTGRRKAARWTAIGLVAAIGGITAGLIAISHDPVAPLSAADRAPLVDVVIDGQHRLRHPTLGFSILRPPAGYADSPQMAAIMEGATHDPGTISYAYAETPPQAGLLVGIINDAGESRTAFVRSIDGIRHGLEKSARSQLGGEGAVNFVRDDITGDDAHLEAHLHGVLAGIHVQINAYVVHPAARPPAIVSIMVIAPDPAMLADVLTSFRP